MKPLLPPAGVQPLLPNNAPAAKFLARLLDALLVLDVEESCSVGELAHRVGLQPGRLRELLSSLMVAPAEALGPDARFSVVFGTSAGPFDAEADDDAEQNGSEYVFRAPAELRSERVALVDDLGRAPVTVDMVAGAVLAGRALLESGAVEERHRAAVAGLVDKLAAAMNMTLSEAIDPDAQKLREAVDRRQRVAFCYREPGEAALEQVTVEPYDVRRRRDSYLLDAGPDPAEGFRTFTISAMSDLELVGDPCAFEAPVLPAREERDQPIEVVLRVPADSAAFGRLQDGWRARTVARHGAHVDVRILVDRPAAARVGVLVVQLGPGCSVVSPESFGVAVSDVACRILAAHSSG